MDMHPSQPHSRRNFLKNVGMGALGASLLPHVAGKTAQQDKPNVLFIAIDDLNDWVGCYGGHPQAITPNIDRLAAEGVLFENAHCQAPICTPSRASLLSGLYPSTTGLYFLNPQHREAETLRDVPTLPEYFQQHGYKSYGVGKVFHTGDDPLAFDEYGGTLGGFGPLPDEKISLPKGHRLWDWGAFPDDDADKPDYKVAQWAKNKLAEEHDAPFFLSVGFWRPHVPLYAPQKWFDMHPRDQVALPEAALEDLDDIPPYARELAQGAAAPRHEYVCALGEWEHAVQAYLACTTFVDHYIGEVLEALRQSKYADNTYVVFWSDHGFHLGEKLRWGKRSLWEESTRAPLIIAGPGITPGQRCTRPVGMIDLFPTLVELCGLTPREELEGNSLQPLLDDPETPWERPALTTFGPNNHSLRSERYRYTRYADGSEELYDHHVDSREQVNLARSEAHRPIMDAFQQWLPAVNRPPLPGSGGADSMIYGPTADYGYP